MDDSLNEFSAEITLCSYKCIREPVKFHVLLSDSYHSQTGSFDAGFDEFALSRIPVMGNADIFEVGLQEYRLFQKGLPDLFRAIHGLFVNRLLPQ